MKTNIENNTIFLFFIIIFPFCKNKLQKCFKKPFLGQVGGAPCGILRPDKLGEHHQLAGFPFLQKQYNIFDTTFDHF